MRKSRTICALLPLQCRRQNDMMEMNKKIQKRRLPHASFSKGKNTYLILQENFIVLHPFNLLGEMDLAKKGCSLKKMVVMATLTVH